MISFRRKLLGLLALIALTYPWPLFAKEAAKLLGWVVSDNICGGYYKELPQVLACPMPAAITDSPTTVTATHSALFSQHGTSILQGQVVVTQPGREILADKACLYRDIKSFKVTTLDLTGDVHFIEAGKLIVADNVKVDLKNNHIILHDAFYHLAKNIKGALVNAWGKAKQIRREQPDELNLQEATYTTCSPAENTWMLKASQLNLNRDSGRGVATNAKLTVKGTPVFYLPYVSFALDDRRKSGFLYPTLGYANSSGANLSLPYYFNLAPNYDFTLTPHIFSRRGVQWNGLWRYLALHNIGTLQLSLLPGDEAFGDFKNKMLQDYGKDAGKLPFLSRLSNASNTRGFIAFNNNTQFNNYWQGTVNINYATDDYFLQDFPAFANNMLPGANQLLNQIDLNYQDENWQFLGRLQGYETLHAINASPIVNQYNRLPQLDLNGNFPQQPYGLDYKWQSSITNFAIAKDFLTGKPVVAGGRLRIAPSVSLPLTNTAGYFTPGLQLDTSYYNLHDQIQGSKDNMARVLPIFNIDSGLVFTRNLIFANKSFSQTLEPRLFYLFVPNTYQADIPIFDTILPPFSFEQLFRTNRFIGFDRIGDANQISAAITSRFLDSYTGQEKMRINIGEIYYFTKHHICLSENCIDDHTIGDTVSPIVAEINYYLNSNWSANLGTTWDPNQKRINSNNVNFQYKTDAKHIVNFGYNFNYGNDIINGANPLSSENNFNRINISTVWPIKSQWSFIGNWYYNISHGHPQTYLYGLQYDSCCWAMRFIASRSLAAEDINSTRFDTSYYLQFQLKGFGNIGNNDPGNLLASVIPGYEDKL